MSWQIRLIILAVLLVSSFALGWRVKTAFVAERDLAIEQAKAAMIEAYRANEADSARILEEKLASLRANERVIEREKLKIIDRPVYRNECLDADGVSLINQARSGKAGPAEPAGEVPRAK
jgi:hypothetical protein